MSYTIAEGSLFPCQQSGCVNKVRLFKSLDIDSIDDFKCAHCMGLKGYTYCIECNGMCITDTIYCFFCEKDYFSLLTPIPIAPEPSIKPSFCQDFESDKDYECDTDIQWTYDRYKADMNNKYVWGWWCSKCIEFSAMST